MMCFCIYLLTYSSSSNHCVVPVEGRRRQGGDEIDSRWRVSSNTRLMAAADGGEGGIGGESLITSSASASMMNEMMRKYITPR